MICNEKTLPIGRPWNERMLNVLTRRAACPDLTKLDDLVARLKEPVLRQLEQRGRCFVGSVDEWVGASADARDYFVAAQRGTNADDRMGWARLALTYAVLIELERDGRCVLNQGGQAFTMTAPQAPDVIARPRGVRVRLMDVSDLPTVSSFRSGPDDPWDADFLTNVMENGFGTAVVATDESDRVLGYAVYSIREDSDGQEQDVVPLFGLGVNKVTVGPDYRRRHIGAAFVEAMQADIIRNYSGSYPIGRLTQVAAVPESDLTAQLFFRRLGFAVPSGATCEAAPEAGGAPGYMFVRDRYWGLAAPEAKLVTG